MPSPKEVAEAKRICPQLTGITGPIGVLVANHAACHRSSLVHAHIRGEGLPQGSLIELAPDIRCAGPSLLASELAPRLSHLELLMLLSELFGLYAISSTEELGVAQRNRPILSPDKLTSFLDDSGSARGTGMLKRAIAQAPVQAASPMEARLYLRATAPRSEGGYGFSSVVLNDPLRIAALSRESPALRTRKPDLLFVGRGEDGERKVCLDYMGAQHESSVRADTARRNELLAAGFRPYEIYKEHYDDLSYMDALMEQIRCDLGLPRPDTAERKAMRQAERRHDLWQKLEAVDMRGWTQREELR